MAVRSLNKVMLIGNLTRDPELRYTSNGTAVCSFGLATNRSWKNESNEIQEVTDFHNIVAWTKMAEICNQILAKGMKVYIEGSIVNRSWQDESGTTKYKTEIRVTDLILLDGRGKQGVGSTGKASEPTDKSAEDLLNEISAEEGTSVSEEPAAKDKNEDPLSDDMPF